jgi:hypothetical protein
MTNGVLNGNGRIKRVLLLTYITFCFLVVCMGTIVTVSLYPFEPIKYSKIDLLYSTVKAGGYVWYTANFCKSVNQVGTMTRYLVSMNGGATITLNPGGLADAKITDKSKTVMVEIPDDIKPGKYKIKWVVVYSYFGIRQIPVWAETPEFMVVK